MNRTLIKLNFLGYYQIIGGIIGFLLSIALIVKQPIINGISFLIIMIVLGLMSFSTYCGYLLIKKQLKKGINLSIINQALQIIGFGVLGYGFKYTSGILLGVRIDLTNDFIIGLDLNITSWTLYWNSNFDLSFISINFFAIFILGFIFKVKDTLEKKNLLN
ncbi:hypothetical protein [Altibacter lentus]|uniref:hypothetical protein n=1 Tax=Altibacter lentus TaxID=1223410 RepID=UPI0005595E96|nr:hypothetical protein [Altibacter lentus]